uniref:Cytolysin B transport protein n=1 Tax=Lactococcus lactis TaxID=1358 RepID=O87239_9LACT|nr:peptidase domain-containing ABC transporter [Lactococcus lactis]AAC56012.1 cytolysin B transport protein [Lactococcus lactis]
MKKLKSTFQVAQTECGLCCVRTILDYFGYETTVTKLRILKEPGRDGSSFNDIRKLLERFGVDSKLYKVKDNRIFSTLQLPIIIYWKNVHFVCVERISKKTVIIMDPSVGRTKMSLTEFFQNFSGLILIPKKNTEKFKKNTDNIINTWRKSYIWPSKTASLYMLTGILSLFIIASSLLLPLATQYSIDNLMKENFSLIKIISGLGAFSIFMFIVYYFRTMLSIKIMYNFSWNLINRAFTRILSLPAKYFTVRAPGEITYRLGAMNNIREVLGPKLVQSVLDVFSTLLLLIYCFCVSIVLGGVILSVLLVILLFLVVTNNYVTAATDKEIREGGDAQNIQLDALVSINNLKLGGYKEIYLNDWRNNYKSFLKATAKRMKIQDGYIGSSLYMIQAFMPLLLLVISLKMVQIGTISLGVALSIQTISSMIFIYANSIFNTITNLAVSTRYIELADDIFEYPLEDDSGTEKCGITFGSIVMKDVDFRYTPDSKDALKHISIDINAGQTVALVGISGSGKTTLGKIISTLFKPSKGQIFFDGVEIKNHNLDSLRKYVGYIPQEAHLHNRTIMENLLLGSNYPQQEVLNYCNSLKFLDFIQDLPMGYQTVVSEMGGNLSGGQKQRIHIARILLQKPKLLVMDEATSSLDNISQSEVYEALEKEINCTKVVIAHRLETILKADKIFVLENGRIIEQGNHDELLNNKGIYKKIYTSK